MGKTNCVYNIITTCHQIPAAYDLIIKTEIIVFRILTRFAHMFDNMTLVTVSPPEYDTPTVSPQGIMMLWAGFLQILDMPI